MSELGVFVDGAGGKDANAGTKESPVKSIGAALAKLGTKNSVYVCEGTYDEHVKVTKTVSLYGGFACSGWSHTGRKSAIAPASKGYALEISGASSALFVEDLELTAVDATEPGASSVAVFVSSSSKVTFRRVSATAGKGMPGTDATDATDFVPASAPNGTGGAESLMGVLGASTPNGLCPTSIGGAGGNNGTPNAGAGQVAIAVFPAGYTGAGGVGGEACGITGPRDGSYGIAGTAGAGATNLGTLDASGWKGGDGAPGGGGGHGQGGGGGAQKTLASGGVGGSGGPGGCGGAGGGKGTGGGSSIALLVFESSVALEQSTVTAKDAGRGGNGAKGQKAQLASTTNAAPNSGATACAGGIGGVGGSGGGGGGGAGGVSAGIVYKGTAPSIDGASTQGADTLPSVTLGTKGAAGGRGAGGDAAQAAPLSRAGIEGTAGAEGAAKAVMSGP